MPVTPLEEMAFGQTIKKILNDSLSSSARHYQRWFLDFKKEKLRNKILFLKCSNRINGDWQC